MRFTSKVEIGPGEHLRNVRVMVGDVVVLGLVDGPFGNDVAGADELGVRALGEVRQIAMRNAAAADDADADFFAAGSCGGSAASAGGGRRAAALAMPASVSAAPVPTVLLQELRRSIPPERMCKLPSLRAWMRKSGGKRPPHSSDYLVLRGCAKRFCRRVRKRRCGCLKRRLDGGVSLPDRAGQRLAPAKRQGYAGTWGLTHGNMVAHRSNGGHHRRHDGPGPVGGQGMRRAGAQVVVCGRNPESAAERGAGLGVGGAGARGRRDRSRHRGRGDSAGARHASAASTALYHVAGGSGRRAGDGPLHEVTDDGVEATLEHNLTSLIYSNRAAVQAFLERGHRRVGAQHGECAGVESVAAIFRDARLRRREVGDHRLHQELCRLLRAARHPLQRASRRRWSIRRWRQRAVGDDAIQQFIRAKQPLDGGRVGRPEDLDAAVVFFLSDGSRYVTGQVLAVDGGWTVSDAAAASPATLNHAEERSLMSPMAQCLARCRELVAAVESRPRRDPAHRRPIRADDSRRPDGAPAPCGSGHSRIMVEEMWPRYGSFPGFNPLVELSLSFHHPVVGSNGQRQAMFLENVPGLAARILRNFDITLEDAALVVSSSGCDVAPIEIAEGFHDRGVFVAALVRVGQLRTLWTPAHRSVRMG